MITRTTSGSSTATQPNAGWYGRVSKHLGLPAPVVGRVHRKRNIAIPMADGIQLLADHWTPVGTTDAPLLLVRCPYGRAGIFGLIYGRFFAHQGFQVLMQSCRGTAGSGGKIDRPFAAEAEDGAATVEWVIEQPWYPGSFCTAGASYLGYTQLALAKAAKGHLKAAVLQHAPTSVRAMAWPDDSFALQAALGWAGQAHEDPSRTIRNLLGQRKLDKRVRVAGTTAPLQTSYRLATGTGVPFFEDWLGHADPADPWWDALDHADGLEHFDCPVLVQGGWYDLFLASSIEQYQRLHDRGVPVELTIGPWIHLDRQGSRHHMGEAAAFLREKMNVQPRGEQPSAVSLIEVGSDARVGLASWPAIPSEVRTLHIAGPGRLADAPALEGPETTTFRYDPADPTPHVGGSTLEMAAGQRDNRTLESRSDVMTFDSEELAADLHLLGEVGIDLWFDSDRPSTSLFVRLCQVDADGTSTNLTDRMLQLASSARTSEGGWHVVATLAPLCAVLRSGTVLRLQVSSGAFPQYARHSGTDEPAGSVRVYYPARQVMHHSPAYPATVTLPLRSP